LVFSWQLTPPHALAAPQKFLIFGKSGWIGEETV
jgi:hypothetical protein